MFSLSKHKLFVGFIVLFFAFFPIANMIDFAQNDDWVYYKMVERILSGNLTLHPYISPTFYTQGFMAAIFSKIFSIQKLPILTLALAVANSFILAKIIKDFYNRSNFEAYVLGLLFFLNPVSLYLSLGFMTGVYFAFFLLAGVYYFYKFEESKNFKYLYFVFILTALGMLVRQIALFLPLSIFAYYFIKDVPKLKSHRKELLLSFFVFALYYFYYEFLFPATPRIEELPLQFHHILDFDYSFALIYGSILLMVAYLLPLFVSLFNFGDLLWSKKKLISLAVVSALFFVFFADLFNPNSISWGEFPYFENTFERTGFYPRGIGGTKYHFIGIFDLYRSWDLGAKILLSLISANFLLFKKEILLKKNPINFPFVLGVVYVGVLLVTETFYDRYLYNLIPIIILWILSLKPTIDLKIKILLVSFIAFLAFFGYQLSMDFVRTNKYVWNRALEISRDEKIPKNKIQGTNAWKLSNVNSSPIYLYDFSYDSPKVNEGYEANYLLVETKEIDFPLSFFVNPKIYLYRLNSK